MAQTLSNMLPLGTEAPHFSLLDTTSNQLKNLLELKGAKGTVIMFICNHCPFVIHVNHLLVQLALRYQKQGIGFIAISSNDVIAYPQDDPKLMKAHAIKHQYPFPYLYDETQEVAKSYAAACTPDFYIFDKDLRLAYRGQLDDSRPGNGIPPTGASFINALDAICEQQTVSVDQKPSIGCNIKWK